MCYPILARIETCALIHCMPECKTVQPVWSLKNRLLVSLKTEHIASILPSTCIPEYLSQRNQNLYPQKNLNTNDYNSFIHNSQNSFSKLRKHLKCPFTENKEKKLWCVHMMERYSAIKRNSP